MHVARSDLDLDRPALGAEHRRVQGLVHVRLGHRDVVLEPARDGLPERVDGTERAVAVAHRLDLDADADQVEDLFEVLAADHHLFVDRVQMLRASVDVGLDPELLQFLPERVGELQDAPRPLVATRLDELGDLLVRPRMQRLEGEVLELPLDLLDTEAVGQRGVDLEGLGGDPALLGDGQRRECPHVVETVGELDQQHADVARHRHDHLAHVLGLRQLAGLELQLVELRQAVDDLGDIVAELLAEPVEGDGRVLHGVVQQRRLERRRVQAQVGEDLRHRQRMFDERLPREAHLALVGLLGDPIGGLEHLEVALGVVGADLLLQRREPGRRMLGATAARQGETPTSPSGWLCRTDRELVPGIHACGQVYGRHGPVLALSSGSA